MGRQRFVTILVSSGPKEFLFLKLEALGDFLAAVATPCIIPFRRPLCSDKVNNCLELSWLQVHKYSTLSMHGDYLSIVDTYDIYLLWCIWLERKKGKLGVRTKENRLALIYLTPQNGGLTCLPGRKSHMTNGHNSWKADNIWQPPSWK